MYQVLYADPPWDYGGQKQYTPTGNINNKVKSAIDHYPTMKLNELKKLKVSELCEKNAVLFMWSSSPHLNQSIELMEAWGFKYKTIAFVWEKHKLNPGSYTVSQCEICIVGTKGSIPKPRGSRKERQFLSEMRGKHSAKPIEIRERIMRMFPIQKKIELFCRGKVEGWDAWGNEIESDISLSTLP